MCFFGELDKLVDAFRGLDGVSFFHHFKKDFYTRMITNDMEMFHNVKMYTL